MQIREYNHNNLFQCKIIYSPKRRRSLCISVTPDGVFVRAPNYASDKAIFDFIQQKERTILKQIQKVSSIQKITGQPLIDREFLYFLGEKYLLKISQSKLLKKFGFCEIQDNCFFATLPYSEQAELAEKLETAVKNWYKKRACEIFNERAEYLANLHNFQYKKINVREQKSLWGSCNHQNILSFNWKVVQCHIDIVDYLIIHELTHTLHRNHSQKFWQKVGEILPNYKQLQKQLKDIPLISI